MKLYAKKPHTQTHTSLTFATLEPYKLAENLIAAVADYTINTVFCLFQSTCKRSKHYTYELLFTVLTEILPQ